MPHALPLLLALLSIEDPLAGMPDVEECERAIAINLEWQTATKLRLEHSICAWERHHLRLALEEGELIRIAWSDLRTARACPHSTATGMPYWMWVKLEIGESRWRLRAMPPPVPWWTATPID